VAAASTGSANRDERGIRNERQPNSTFEAGDHATSSWTFIQPRRTLLAIGAPARPALQSRSQELSQKADDDDCVFVAG